MSALVWAIVAIGVFPLLMFIGRRSISNDLDRINDKARFTGEYLNKFQMLASSSQFDGQLYKWLMERCDTMQRQLGGLGIVTYTAPYGGPITPRYAVLLNEIPKMRSGDAHPKMLNSVEDILIRYIGYLREQHKHLSSQYSNPFAWLQQGIRVVLLVPAYILSGAGLLKPSSVDSLAKSGLMTAASGLLELAAIAGTIIGIVTGWEPFMKILQVWEWLR